MFLEIRSKCLTLTHIAIQKLKGVKCILRLDLNAVRSGAWRRDRGNTFQCRHRSSYTKCTLHDGESDLWDRQREVIVELPQFGTLHGLQAEELA